MRHFETIEKAQFEKFKVGTVFIDIRKQGFRKNCVGDVLILQEIDHDQKATGNEIDVDVQCVDENKGLKQDYVLVRGVVANVITPYTDAKIIEEEPVAFIEEQPVSAPVAIPATTRKKSVKEADAPPAGLDF